MVHFHGIKLGGLYDRIQLAKLWEYNGHQAISRGVVTPSGSNLIILFVTHEKQTSLTQYVDYIHDDYLYWEGEEKGGSNQRIINSVTRNDEIHLFFRNKHHQLFIYMGVLALEDYVESKSQPFQFIFKIIGEKRSTSETGILKEPSYASGGKPTQQSSMVLSRIGQGAFRVNLFKLWNACSLSAVQMPEILRASHIKPWKDSNNDERLNPYNGLLLTPTYDALFDKGFVSFENNGQIIISRKLDPYVEALQLSASIKLRRVFPENVKFLDYHRENLLR